MNRYRTRLERLESLHGPPDLDDVLARIAEEDGLTPAEVEEVRTEVLADLRRYQGMSIRQIISVKAAELGCSAAELIADSEHLQEAYRS